MSVGRAPILRSASSCASVAIDEDVEGATFWSTCSADVAPNSTLATAGFDNANATGERGGSRAHLVGEGAELRRRPAAPVASRGASTARANRPSPVPARYFPESAPPASTADATTLTSQPSSAATISSSSTGNRDTRLYGSCAAQGAATPRLVRQRARVVQERR